MIKLSTPTSVSNMNLVHEFSYICDLIKCSKCIYGIVLKRTNKLYAINSTESYCIHEVDIPFLVDGDLCITYDASTKNMLSKYSDFFIPDKYPEFYLPSYYWDMYQAGDIEVISDSVRDYLIDKVTKQPIDYIPMWTTRIALSRSYLDLSTQIEGLINRMSVASKPVTFSNMEAHPDIRRVFDSKTIDGRFLCHLQKDNIDVLFYMFKGAFSLAKADTLEIDIRFDPFESHLFIATFKPKKKKSPLMTNKFGVDFHEKVHCMYINMS